MLLQQSDTMVEKKRRNGDGRNLNSLLSNNLLNETQDGGDREPLLSRKINIVRMMDANAAEPTHKKVFSTYCTSHTL